MPTKSLIQRYKAKDIDKIVTSLIRARDATQQAIDRFDKFKPEGKIKALKNNSTFRKQSGIAELDKQIKLLDSFISKLLDYQSDTSDNLDKILSKMGYVETSRGQYSK